MALETRVILTSVLTTIKTSASLDEVEAKIEAMCEKDWILAANEAAEKLRAMKNKAGQ